MRPGQRELGQIVVENRRGPTGRGMTYVAGGRKTGRLMIGVGGIVVIILVAGHAIGGGAGITVRVTLYAVQSRVRPGKRELGLAVIKDRRAPAVYG